MEQVTKATFDAKVLKSSDVTLVDFFAPWCGPCMGMMPVLEELSKELPAGTKIVKINVDDEQDIAGKYGVMSIPSFKVIKGGQVVAEAVGTQSKDALLKLISDNK